MTKHHDPLVAEVAEAYCDWLDRGAPDYQPFLRASGLCGNAFVCGGYGASDAVERAVRDEFGNAFPFGAADFFARRDANTQHEDPARIALARRWAGRDEGE